MRTAVILLATIFVVFAGYFLVYQGKGQTNGANERKGGNTIRLEGNQIVQGPILGTNVSGFPDERLVDQDGEPVRIEDLRGTPVLMSFIYTRCPEKKMCPMITRKMARVQERINETEDDSATFVSVTFDPETDTPGTLREYGKQHGVNFQNWSFWTGPSETIERLTDRFQITAKEQSGSDVMLHNMRTYVLSKDLDVAYAWKGSQWSADDVLDKLQKLQSDS